MDPVHLLLGMILAVLLAERLPLLNLIPKGGRGMQLNVKRIQKSAGIDPAKEKEGIWQNLSTIPGAKMKIARMRNPKFEQLYEKLYKPHRKKISRGVPLDPETQFKINAELTVKTLVTDWSGIPGKDAEGKDCHVPFSEKIARELFFNSTLKDVMDEVWDWADQTDGYLMEIEEEIKEVLPNG